MPVDQARAPFRMKRVPYPGDLPGEEWRTIVGYEGRYEVSSCGRVRNCHKSLLAQTPTKGLSPNGTRYGCVMLIGHDRSRNWFLAHALVASSFIGPCPDGMECRHLNDRRDDNRVENLAWGTPKQNAEDRGRNGHSVRGVRVVQSKMTDEIVAEARRRVANGETRTAVARSIGVSITAVSAAVGGDWWKHVPGALPKKSRIGEGGCNVKLHDTDVLEIRRRCDGGERQASVARDFPSVSYSTVCKIAQRVAWRHLP